ncbi:hypothetical protein F4780DRAFT_775097 [Xylariomycetidae sp. FL0641]|nr:hypothetical protein F4780DRAFT_775097 [Xylariomycetidae sp. FL0641]
MSYSTSYLYDEPLRSPVVSRPPSSYYKRMGVTEEDLDPDYGRSIHSRKSRRSSKVAHDPATVPAAPASYSRRMSMTEEDLGIHRGDPDSAPPGTNLDDAESEETDWLVHLLLGLCLAALGLAGGIYYFGFRTPSSSSPAEPTSNSTSSSLLAPPPGRALSRYYNLNHTAEMEPFWAGYRDVLTESSRFGAWFDDVDAASAALAAMWAAVPAPSASGSSAAADARLHADLERKLAARTRALAAARDAWDAFLRARHRLRRDMIASAALWHVGVGPKQPQQPQSPSSSASSQLNHTQQQQQQQQPWLQALGANASDPAALRALTRTARRVAGDLTRAHRSLWSGSGSGNDGCDEALARAVAAVAAIPPGAEAFVRALRARSSSSSSSSSGAAGGDLWTPAHAAALPRLRRRVRDLGRRREDMRAALGWLGARFADADADEEGKRLGEGEGEGDVDALGRDLGVWAQSASELLQTWASVLLDAQEGVVFEMRRRELGRQEGVRGAVKVNLTGSWDAWKGRNCGGTSCFDAPPRGRVEAWRRWFKKQGRPVAGVAEDEDRWGPGVRVWRGVYEKACCEEGRLAELLRMGAEQPGISQG